MSTEPKFTPGPWNLVWWGNEQWPYPLSILADNDGVWIARDGTVSSEANARLIAAAPELFEALQILTANIEHAFPSLAHLGPVIAARTALSKANPGAA